MPDEFPLLDMAFERKLAEARVRGKEETINLHAVKLLGFAVPETTREYWRKEIRAETSLLARLAIRTGKGVRRFREAELFTLLYREPFEQNELPYSLALLDSAMAKSEQGGQKLRRNAAPVAEIAAAVRAFHVALAPQLAAGTNGWPAIEALP